MQEDTDKDEASGVSSLYSRNWSLEIEVLGLELGIQEPEPVESWKQ